MGAIRTDTTVVESNIHYPTDSSLLWDTWRVATRLLGRAREILRPSVPHRFHTRKVKKLHLFITRYVTSKSKSRREQVKASFRTLIERVDWIVAIAADFCEAYRSSSHLELSAVALELQAYLPSMQTVAATALGVVFWAPRRRCTPSPSHRRFGFGPRGRRRLQGRGRLPSEAPGVW